MNYNFQDAMLEQRIITKLKEDYALVKNLVDEGRNVSRSIVLGRIVCYMRKRHQAGRNIPMTLHQLLTGTEQQYLAWSIRYWLCITGLPEHQKIATVHAGLKFLYKPTYDIKNRTELMSLLKKVYDENEDGIPLDVIMESLPRAEKILDENPSGFITLTRLADKKKVLFYGKKALDLTQMDKDLKISLTYAVPIQRMDTEIKSDSDSSVYLQRGGNGNKGTKKSKFDDSDETDAFDDDKTAGLYASDDIGETDETNESGNSSKDESTDSNIATVSSDDSNGRVKSSGVAVVAKPLAGSSKVMQKLDCSVVSKNLCDEVIVCEPDMLPKDCDDFGEDEMSSF